MITKSKLAISNDEFQEKCENVFVKNESFLAHNQIDLFLKLSLILRITLNLLIFRVVK